MKSSVPVPRVIFFYCNYITYISPPSLEGADSGVAGGAVPAVGRQGQGAATAHDVQPHQEARQEPEVQLPW